MVHLVLATRSEEVTLLYLIRPDTLGDADHPEELVDIVTRIAEETTKDDQDVINLVLAHDRVADLLTRAHGLAHRSNVRVVPGVVVNQGRAVGHATNLIAIIPPRHNLGILLGVLSQPLVSLSVIINNVLATVRKATSQHNRWGGIGVGSDPGAVGHKHEKIDRHGTSHDDLRQGSIDANVGLLSCTKATLCLLGRFGALGGNGILIIRLLELQIGVENLRHGNGSGNAHNRSQSEHEADHDTGKIAAKESVNNNEDMLVSEVLEAQVDTCREEPDKEVEVEEERRPSGRLVLRDRGDDGNMNLGVASVPERVESTAPGSNVSQSSQGNETSETKAKCCDEKSNKESLELSARNGGPNVLDEADQLKKTEDACAQMLESLTPCVNL